MAVKMTASWRAAGTAAVSPIVLVTSSERRCCSMSVHLDRKWLDGLDGNVIAIVVIRAVFG
jgi:hypothetical protein